MRLQIPERGFISLIVITICVISCPVASQEPEPRTTRQTESAIQGLNHPDRIFGSYIVVFDSKPEVKLNPAEQAVIAQAVEEKTVELAVAYGGEVESIYTTIIHGFAISQLPEHAASAIAENFNVDYVQVDQVAHSASGGTQYFNHQIDGFWGLDRIDQFGLPLDEQYTYPNGGYNITYHEAFILDSGIDDTISEFSSGSGGSRVLSGWNVVESSSDTSDCLGHGTFVSGIVGGATFGVAKEARLRPVKITDGCVSGSKTSWIIDAVDWVAYERQVQMWNSWWMAPTAVLNLSYGIAYSHPDPEQDPDAMESALDNLASNDDLRVVVINSAGNSDADACAFSPALSSNILTVGATQLDSFALQDERWEDSMGGPGSNYGSCVDLFAPGHEIRSSKPGGASEPRHGTSYATPFVAGAALMYTFENPQANSSQVRSALVNSATQGQINNIGVGSPNLLLNIEFISN